MTNREDWLSAKIAYINGLKSPSEQQRLLVLLAEKKNRTTTDEKTLSALIRAEKTAEKAAAEKKAKAKKEAAVFEAEAEVERAKGVAQANKIIGESLNENENYLRYLWIQSLNDGNAETIYVPTEANLPILEADRFSQPKRKGAE